MLARERELPPLTVDAEEPDARELLAEHREHRARPTADLEEARSRGQGRSIADEPLSPMLRLRDEPFLLRRAVAVHVLGHVRRLGKRLCAAARHVTSV